MLKKSFNINLEKRMKNNDNNTFENLRNRNEKTLIISLPRYNLSNTEFSFEKMPKLLSFESFWPNLVI